MTRSTVGSASWVEPSALKQPMVPSLLTRTWSVPPVTPSQIIKTSHMGRGRRVG